MIALEYLDTILEYDSESGSFTWRERPRSAFKTNAAYVAFLSKFAGKRAGHLRLDGYRDINIGGRLYLEHRLVWLKETGTWPIGDIDHIDGDGAHNRFINLRDVSHAINGRNSRKSKSNRSGVTGVGWNIERGKWRARITVGRKTKLLGYFASKDDAISARKAAEAKYGFHENHGRPA